MDLAIKYTYEGRVWVGAEVGRIKAGVLADARGNADKGDYFSALLALLSGSVTEIVDSQGEAEDDRSEIRTLLQEMPSRDLEQLGILSLLTSNGEDSIEGYYVCPRCGEKKICEGESADKIEDLKVEYLEEVDPTVDISLKDPVVLVNRKDDSIIMEVKTLKLRHTTARDYIRAFSSVGISDEVRYQYEAYANSIIEANGQKVDDQWRRRWGMHVVERLDSEDIRAVSKAHISAGLQTTVKKICSKCGKSWDAEVSTSSFFVSGLAAK